VEFLGIPTDSASDPIPNSVAEFSRVWKGIALQHKTICDGEGKGCDSAMESRNWLKLDSTNSGIG
jgi:hypothetical protein